MGGFSSDLAMFEDIPDPIAPARPSASGGIPVTYNGQAGTLDTFGNVIGANGNLITAIPGSVGDIGTSGKQTPTTTPSPASTPSNGIFSGILGGLSSATGVTIPGQANTGLFTQLENWLTVHAENAVIIIVGLILIAAGVFSFKSTQTVIQTVGKVAKKGAELAA